MSLGDRFPVSRRPANVLLSDKLDEQLTDFLRSFLLYPVAGFSDKVCAYIRVHTDFPILPKASGFWYTLQSLFPAMKSEGTSTTVRPEKSCNSVFAPVLGSEQYLADLLKESGH